MGKEMEPENENKKQPAEGRMMIDLKLVGEQIPQVIHRRTMEARFKFDMPTQTALNILAAHYACAVLRRHKKPRFDENTQQNLYALAKCLTAEEPKFGVMFCGTCGNGKSTMLEALMTATLSLGENHFKYIHERFDPLMRIMDARDVVLLGKDFDTIRRLRSRDLLAIDDFGKEPAEVMDYGTMLNPLVHLLEFRYNQQLFTAISTNLTASEIKAKYGARIADRFNEMLNVIVFQDISYRR